MSLSASHEEVLQAAQHLPNGATLVIHEFEWDEYERLLKILEDRPHLRVSYDCGRLEILSPSTAHANLPVSWTSSCLYSTRSLS